MCMGGVKCTYKADNPKRKRRRKKKSSEKKETGECKMQKMKSGLMMFCLTVLLSCAALMMNTGTASAMTLQDLCGDYRIVGETRALKAYYCSQIGCIVSFNMEDGTFIGKQKDASGKLTGHDYITNVYVHNGTIHCWANIQGLKSRNDCWIRIYNNGATLEIVDNDPIHGDEPVFLKLSRM